MGRVQAGRREPQHPAKRQAPDRPAPGTGRHPGLWNRRGQRRSDTQPVDVDGRGPVGARARNESDDRHSRDDVGSSEGSRCGRHRHRGRRSVRRRDRRTGRSAAQHRRAARTEGGSQARPAVQVAVGPTRNDGLPVPSGCDTHAASFRASA